MLSMFAVNSLVKQVMSWPQGYDPCHKKRVYAWNVFILESTVVQDRSLDCRFKESGLEEELEVPADVIHKDKLCGNECGN